MQEENRLRVDPLFLGLTRAPMIFGVTYEFALINVFICVILYIMNNNLIYLLALFPIHLLGFVIHSKEPLFMKLLRIRGEKCSRSRNRFYHQLINSYDQW